MKIFNEIKRLNLHDSHFEIVERFDDILELTFDWSYLENFNEEGIKEGIILGRTKFTIFGITNEEFKGYKDETKWKLIQPINIVNSWKEIATTEINEEKKSIMLNGMFDLENENFWVEWSFNYEKCSVEWNNHMLARDWRNGTIPKD